MLYLKTYYFISKIIFNMCMFFILISDNILNCNVKRIVIAIFTLKKYFLLQYTILRKIILKLHWRILFYRN